MDEIKKISEEIKKSEYKMNTEKNEKVKEGYFNRFIDLTIKKNKMVSEKIKEDRKKRNFDKYYESVKDFQKRLNQ